MKIHRENKTVQGRVDVEFLFSDSTQYLTYQTSTSTVEEKFHISKKAFIILFLKLTPY